MMNGNLQKSPQLGYPADSTDAKYISGLSTLLVATIQEAKDKISQIEYIFCSQIYPNFQSQSKSSQKLYSEAREAAEAAWKDKERDLLLQIEKFQLEKQQFLDEIHSLKLEKEKFVNNGGLSHDRILGLQEELSQKIKEVEKGKEAEEHLSRLLESKTSLILDNQKLLKELEGKNIQLSRSQKGLEAEVEALQLDLATKCKEIDSGMELQNKLLEMVRSKTSLVLDQEKSLKCHEEKANALLSELGIMNKKVDELQQELKKRTEEIEKGKESQENLFKKVESRASEIMEREQLLDKYENEKRLLAAKLEKLVNDFDLLQKEIWKQNDELIEGRKLKEQLVKQIDLNNLERLKTGQKLEELEKEKEQLLAKLKGSKEKFDELQLNLCKRSKECSECMEIHDKLLQLIEEKDSQLMSEKKKRRDGITAYKKLKSQYNFLCAKYGLTKENMLPQSKTEEETEALGHNPSPLISDANKVPNPNASGVAGESAKRKVRQEILEGDEGVQTIHRSNSVSPASKTFIEPKAITNVRSCPPVGTKRPVSYWRDTRSHQSRLGPDPHDDFLDTPLEKIRGDLGKTMKDETDRLPKPAPEDMNFGSSEDETQDMNVELRPKEQQIPPPRAGTSNYKYVEPVRKKSERENLKGIECKQCKKFYDAVLPDKNKEASGNKQNLRCEHHEGVSRHRYRYAPPLTPEGFWNIGFESEM